MLTGAAKAARWLWPKAPPVDAKFRRRFHKTCAAKALVPCPIPRSKCFNGVDPITLNELGGVDDCVATPPDATGRSHCFSGSGLAKHWETSGDTQNPYTRQPLCRDDDDGPEASMQRAVGRGDAGAALALLPAYLKADVTKDQALATLAMALEAAEAAEAPERWEMQRVTCELLARDGRLRDASLPSLPYWAKRWAGRLGAIAWAARHFDPQLLGTLLKSLREDRAATSMDLDGAALEVAAALPLHDLPELRLLIQDRRVGTETLEALSRMLPMASPSQHVARAMLLLRADRRLPSRSPERFGRRELPDDATTVTYPPLQGSEVGRRNRRRRYLSPPPGVEGATRPSSKARPL